MSSGLFIYPDVAVDSNSPALSFHPVTVTDMPCPPDPTEAPQEARELSIPDIQQHKKQQRKAQQESAKDFFLKMYGRKDMFSKQVSAPIPQTPKEKAATQTTIADPGENLLEMHFGSSDTTESAIADAVVQKKSSLAGLFGMTLDDPLTEDSSDKHHESTDTSSAAKDDTFQSFNSFALESKSTAVVASSTGGAQFFGFDSFASSATETAPPLTDGSLGFNFSDLSSDTNSGGTSAGDIFAGFGSSDPFSSSAAAPGAASTRIYKANAAVESREELLCVYKGVPPVVDKFEISGTVALGLTLSAVDGQSKCSDFDSGVCVGLQIDDTQANLTDITCITSHVDCALETGSSSKYLKATLLPSHTSFSSQQQDVGLTWRESPVMKFRTIPSFRPEYIRARCTIAKKEYTTPAGPAYAAAVTIQILLNKNFNMFLEDIQVMASLSCLDQFKVKEVKSKPSGSHNPAAKVLTWACGSHYPSKQPNFQLECLAVLGVNPNSLPTTVPVIIKMRTSSSIIPGCHFRMNGDGVTTTSTQLAAVESTNAEVAYKSKIEYRFL